MAAEPAASAARVIAASVAAPAGPVTAAFAAALVAR